MLSLTDSRTPQKSPRQSRTRVAFLFASQRFRCQAMPLRPLSQVLVPPTGCLPSGPGYRGPCGNRRVLSLDEPAGRLPVANRDGRRGALANSARAIQWTEGCRCSRRRSLRGPWKEDYLTRRRISARTSVSPGVSRSKGTNSLHSTTAIPLTICARTPGSRCRSRDSSNRTSER